MRYVLVLVYSNANVVLAPMNSFLPPVRTDVLVLYDLIFWSHAKCTPFM